MGQSEATEGHPKKIYMLPVLDTVVASLTDIILKHMFLENVGTRAQPVLEI